MKKVTYDYLHIIESEGKYAFSFCLANFGVTGYADCALYNFSTREKHDCRERILLPGSKTMRSGDGAFSAVSYTSKGCMLRLEPTENGLHLFADYRVALAHTPLTAEFTLTLPSAAEKPRLLGARRVAGLRAQGTVTVKGQTYDFRRECDSAFWGSSSGEALPEGNSLYGYGACGEGSHGLLVAAGAGFFANCELPLVLTDLQPDPKGIMLPWRVAASGNNSLRFTPFFNDRTELQLLGVCTDRLFGFLDGSIEDGDGRAIAVCRLPAVLEHPVK